MHYTADDHHPICDVLINISAFFMQSLPIVPLPVMRIVLNASTTIPLVVHHLRLFVSLIFHRSNHFSVLAARMCTYN